ncbi:MAG: prohibitin family protein [Deltaproteobacteria bacterium]|nr:prohibitin family protein [Deltaproteobacteria bacterium]
MAEIPEIKIPKIPKAPTGTIAAVGIVVLALIIISSAFETVGPGERGVVFSRFGGIQDTTLGEGLRFKIPFIEDIIKIDVRIQKAQTDATASSMDLQEVSSTIAVNYHVDPGMASKVYQEIGLMFKDRVIDPSVQESVKAATAHFTAEELITKREEVKTLIKESLVTRLKPFNIIVDEFNIVSFTFSHSFNTAIEEKQTAEQRVLKAQRDLERVKIESQQKERRAEAEATAQEMQRETITPALLQLRAIEKWDGHFPQVVGGALPFIDVSTLDARKK